MKFLRNNLKFLFNKLSIKILASELGLDFNSEAFFYDFRTDFQVHG